MLKREEYRVCDRCFQKLTDNGHIELCDDVEFCFLDLCEKCYEEYLSYTAEMEDLHKKRCEIAERYKFGKYLPRNEKKKWRMIKMNEETAGVNLFEVNGVQYTSNIPPTTWTSITLEQFCEYQQIKEENKKLQDNWNELKEYCKNNYYGTTTVGILDKMQELEGNNE